MTNLSHPPISRTIRPAGRILIHACLLAALCALAAAGHSAARAAEPIVPARMVRTIPWAGLPMPKNLYDQAELRKRWAAAARDPALKKQADKARKAADKYARIPAAQWIAMIPNRSALPTEASGHVGKVCPFTGANYQWGVWDAGSLDLVNHPFRIKSRFSDTWLLEKTEEWPADYPLKVAGHAEIAHWDGRKEKLAWTYGAGKTTGARYYPANIVWEARLKKIAEEALPALREAYLATGDDAYARPIVAILKRFADVFPAFPQGHPWEVDAARTRRAFLTEPRRKVYLNKRLGEYPCRLFEDNGLIGDARCAHEMALAFLAIEGSPAWGARAVALKRHIRKNLFAELALSFTAVDTRCGNHMARYVTALLAVGIALRDEFLVGRYNQAMMEFLYDHHFYDGISNEGSVMYSYMLDPMVRKWRNEFAPLYPAQAERHPFAERIGGTGSRMSTLLGRESSHNDGYDAVFGANWGMHSGLDKDGREARRRSEAFPGFGAAVLRAGGPGRCLEVFLAFDRAVGHDHDDPLGVQVFCRGVPILNHLGYCVPQRSLDLDARRNPLAGEILKIPFPAPLRVYSEQLDEIKKRYAHLFDVADSPLTKNTVLVDEYTARGYANFWADGANPYGNLEFVRLSPDADGPDAGFEAVEASMANMLKAAPARLDRYRRALLAVTRPDGRPYLVDVFRVKGGSRHLMLWHSHGEETGSTLPDGDERYESLPAWLDSWVPERRDPAAHAWYKRAQGEQAIRQVRVAPGAKLPDVWHHDWRLDWLAWAGGGAGVPDWGNDRIVPVSIRVHGLKPDETRDSEMLGVRALSDYYATFGNVRVGGQRLGGTVTFQDALRYAGQLHRGKPGLATTFVHVLEPTAAGEPPFIRSVARLAPAPNAPASKAEAVALELTFTDGTRDLVAALPEPGRLDFANGLSVDGRFALVRLDADGAVTQARLLGGTHLAYAGQPLVRQPAGTFDGELVRLEGDVSGDRSRSALVVRPTTRWPAADWLAGRTVLVKYRSGRTEGYTVEQAESAGGGRVRLVLKGHPPFVDLWGEVYDVPTKSVFLGPNSNPNHAIPYLNGSRVVFPTLNLDLPFERLGWHDWGISKHFVAGDTDLARLGVKTGVPYAIAPDTRDARVSIAADWSMAGGALRPE
ncbi:MAG: hypothetical protein JXR37_11975 [Kiritimatiellae bacterium]|nr:hypothetical protein [Kiritimatiellia bacterium]